MGNDLHDNISRLHSTEPGYDRLRKNLGLDGDDPSILRWCKSKIGEAASIHRKGKNWYIAFDDVLLTVNAHSYTLSRPIGKRPVLEGKKPHLMVRLFKVIPTEKEPG